MRGIVGHPASPRAALGLACGALLWGIPLSGAEASDAALRRAHDVLLPAVELSAHRASDPTGFQRAYDAARDLQEAVRSAAGGGPGCRPLAARLARYAAARVRQMEGADRPSRADASAGARIAAAARAGLPAARALCRGRGGAPAAPDAPALVPGDDEATFGVVVARAPRGADRAELVIDGRPSGGARVRGGRARFAVGFHPAAVSLGVRFSAGPRRAGAVGARRVGLLPARAAAATPGRRADPSATARLGAALADGPAFGAAWSQDLRTGATAAVNDGAPFPAASLVKLGLLIAVLARVEGTPLASPHAHDLRAMATWSSNLATNRLLARFGGAAAGREGLRRLGALSSTFTGDYTVGTELQPALSRPHLGDVPPTTSGRVTTARDMARALYALHAAAAGRVAARRQTGLSAPRARLMIGWLLASEQRGENIGLFAGGLPRGTAVAQKNGWLSHARHGVAIAYGPAGGRILVMLSVDPRGITPAAARSLGARVARAAVR